MRRSLLAPVLAALLLDADGADRLLKIPAAQELVKAALPEETKRLSGLGFLTGKAEAGHCLSFDVQWNNPGIGSSHVAFYIVDLRTAAVWTGITGLLSLVSNPTLTRLQREARKSTGATGEEYQKAVESHSCGY